MDEVPLPPQVVAWRGREEKRVQRRGLILEMVVRRLGGDVAELDVALAEMYSAPAKMKVFRLPDGSYCIRLPISSPERSRAALGS